MDRLFDALASAPRRALLDALFAKESQTLGQLCEGLEMTRQGASKHLALLEEAGLVAVRCKGR